MTRGHNGRSGSPLASHHRKHEQLRRRQRLNGLAVLVHHFLPASPVLRRPVEAEDALDEAAVELSVIVRKIRACSPPAGNIADQVRSGLLRSQTAEVGVISLVQPMSY